MNTKSLKNSLTSLLILLAVWSAEAQHNLTLQDAVSFALSNNQELKTSELEVDKSHEQTKISRSLYLPSLNLHAQSNHYFKRTPFFGFGPEETNDKINYGRFGGDDQFYAAVSGIQPIFSPLGVPSIQHSRLKEKESAIQRESAKQDIISRVKLNYLEILVLKERIKLQQESIQRNQRALQDARSLFLQGKGLRVDTLRAYTAVKNRQPELLKLQYALETSTIRLKTLIGLNSNENVELTDALVLANDTVIPNEDEVYETSRNSNPDLQLFGLHDQISKQEVDLARSTRLPVLSLVGQYQLQSQTSNWQFGDAYYPSSSFLGVQLSVPLFAGFATDAKIRKARISKEQAELQTKLAHENLRESVHSSIAYIRESQERLKTTLTVRETAQVSYDITQYRYQKGIATRLELTDAEFELNSAKSNYLEAVYDYLSSKILLDKLTGNVKY
jgi:outer membrane protein TolC